MERTEEKVARADGKDHVCSAVGTDVSTEVRLVPSPKLTAQSDSGALGTQPWRRKGKVKWGPQHLGRMKDTWLTKWGSVKAPHTGGRKRLRARAIHVHSRLCARVCGSPLLTLGSPIPWSLQLFLEQSLLPQLSSASTRKRGPSVNDKSLF